MDAIFVKLELLLDFELRLYAKKDNKYYNKLWDDIKNCIKNIHENPRNIKSYVSEIDKQIELILDFVTGEASSYNLSSFLAFYQNGLLHDVLKMESAGFLKNLTPQEPEKIYGYNSRTNAVNFLLSPIAFEKINITKNNDLFESLANEFSLTNEPSSLDDFADKANLNVIVIDESREESVNYSLLPVSEINDATMIDSILHMRRKNKFSQILPTLTSSQEFSEIKSKQTIKYNRLHGLSYEKNADPLKIYKIKRIPLQFLPEFSNVVTLIKNANSKKYILLLVDKYSLFILRDKFGNKIYSDVKLIPNYESLFSFIPEFERLFSAKNKSINYGELPAMNNAEEQKAEYLEKYSGNKWYDEKNGKIDTFELVKLLNKKNKNLHVNSFPYFAESLVIPIV